MTLFLRMWTKKGADTFVLFDCGDAGQINVRISGEADVEVGQSRGLGFDPQRTVFFNAAGDSVS